MYAQICPPAEVDFVSHSRGALVYYCVVCHWVMTHTKAACERREGLMKYAGQCRMPTAHPLGGALNLHIQTTLDSAWFLSIADR